jgi:hypothetical protein
MRLDLRMGKAAIHQVVREVPNEAVCTSDMQHINNHEGSAGNRKGYQSMMG